MCFNLSTAVSYERNSHRIIQRKCGYCFKLPATCTRIQVKILLRRLPFYFTVIVFSLSHLNHLVSSVQLCKHISPRYLMMLKYLLKTLSGCKYFFSLLDGMWCLTCRTCGKSWAHTKYSKCTLMQKPITFNKHNQWMELFVTIINCWLFIILTRNSNLHVPGVLHFPLLIPKIFADCMKLSLPQN